MTCVKRKRKEKMPQVSHSYFPVGIEALHVSSIPAKLGVGNVCVVPVSVISYLIKWIVISCPLPEYNIPKIEVMDIWF